MISSSHEVLVFASVRYLGTQESKISFKDLCDSKLKCSLCECLLISRNVLALSVAPWGPKTKRGVFTSLPLWHALDFLFSPSRPFSSHLCFPLEWANIQSGRAASHIQFMEIRPVETFTPDSLSIKTLFWLLIYAQHLAECLMQGGFSRNICFINEQDR